MSVAQTSELLGLSPWTVRDLIARGVVTTVALPVRRVLIDVRDLASLVDRMKETE